jgi:hypothetical protein
MSYSKGQSKQQINMDSSTHLSTHRSGMDSSVFRFHDINFTVGNGDKRRFLLENVNGKVKWGRKLWLNHGNISQ